MTAYNKIEIIISDIHLDYLVEQLEQLGVTGYTAIDIDRSKGPRRGVQQVDGLLPTSQNSLFFTIATKALTEVVIKEIKPFLDARKGILMVLPLTHVSGLKHQTENE